MRLSFEAASTPAEFESDLCIVGAGAAGFALAVQFLETGHRAVLVEGGGDTATSASHDFLAAEIVSRPFPGASAGRANVIGGSTTLWHGQSLPLDPIDFEVRDWAPWSGWPLSHAEVASFYPQAERLLGLDGMIYDAAAWQHVGVAPPAFDPDLLGCQMSWLAKRRNFGNLYGRAISRSRNITLLHDAYAVEIVTAPSGERVEEIRLRSPGRRCGVVRARQFVLCCGGLETPRLLLVSNRQRPGGVGNEHGLVGRYLQDHPTAYCLELEDLGLLRRLYRPHIRPIGRLFPKIPLSAAAQRRRRALNATAEVVFEAPKDSLLALVQAVWKGEGRLDPSAIHRSLPGLKELPRQGFEYFVRRQTPTAANSRVRVWAHIEQAANPLSRVELSDKVDALGMRKARIDWQLTDLDRHTFDVFAETVKAEFERLGLARARKAHWLEDEREDWQDFVADFFHHMGTTRISEDPRMGVVDQNLSVHGLANLSIASSAVFPTGGASNPTLTILALTLRLAQRLRLALREADA